MDLRFSRLAAVALFAVAPLLAGCHGGKPSELTSAGLTAQAKTDLYYLADDSREGRGPGTNGQMQAAAYVEKRFMSLGLKPLKEVPDYEEPFTAPGRTVIGPKAAFVVGETAAKLNTDFRPLPWGANGSFTGKAAFIGYGINSKAYKYNDFEGLDLTGRVAVAFRYAPHSVDGKSGLNKAENFPPEAALALKARQAKAAGAVALLVVIPPLFHDDDGTLIPFGGTGGMGRGGGGSLPVMSITREYAQMLLGKEHNLAYLQGQIDASNRPVSFLTDIIVSGTTDVINKPYNLKNVVAVLPGKGPTADEYVVVGAHYDHVGRGEFGSRFPGQNRVHNGADDNASGTTALMAVAKQLADAGPQPRSIIFVAFSGEEMGLLGSEYFVRKPPVPLEKIAYMVNLDMVGRLRNNMLYLGGTQTSASMQKVIDDAAAGSGLNLKTIGRGGFGPSDHQSFGERKIPVLFFFTGLHPQYHGPDDDAQLINYEGLANIAQVAKKVVVTLAALPREKYDDEFDAEGVDLAATEEPTTNPSRRPGTRPSTSPASRATSRPAPRSPRASLGVVPAFGADQATDGVAISGTLPGTPAEKAGLAKNDVLTKFGDKKIENLYDLTDALLDAAPGAEVVVEFRRAGKTETVTAKLAERSGPQ